MHLTRLIGTVLALLTACWAVAQPTITTQPRDTTASPGGNAQFRISVSWTTPPTYQWWFKDTAMDKVANPSAATYLLSLTNLTSAQAGPYFVTVTDTTGSATSEVATLTVDSTFTKITTGPVVSDLGCTYGASWGDYDGDGFADLLVLRYMVGTNAVYRNNGDGSFTSVPNLPFAKSSDSWGAGAWADFDNDGHLDLFATCGGKPSHFYFNNGDGTFSPSQGQAAYSAWNIAVADYDQDGLLDLLLSSGNASASAIYRNNGNRTFNRMKSVEVGPIVSRAAQGGACWGDYDDDGWVDVYSSYNGGQSCLYHNQGTGCFTSVINLLLRGSTLAGAWGDYDNDGRLDLCGASFDAATFVYRNLGSGEFEKASIGVTIQGTYNSAAWADYDNDGFLDLFLTYGNNSRNTLYHNNGDGTLARITTGSIVTELPVGGGASYGGLWFDYDNDGFLDLYVVNGDDAGTARTANFLYHNNGNSNAWLKVKLVGTASNRDGVGAKVRIQATYAGQVRWQRRDISGGDYCNGNHLYAHFGLGDATNVDLVRIEWPSGLVQELRDVAPGQLLAITEHQEGAPSAPDLKATGSAEGAVQLMLTGQTNLLYVLQASTNLVQWTKLAVRTNLTGTVDFTDAAATNYTWRFYRGVAP